MTKTRRTPRSPLLSPQNRLIAILGAIAAIGPLSIDMYLPGFPAIAQDLNTSISQVSLSLTAYFAGISAGQFIYGPLLDRYGRKRPLLIGFALYLLAAIGCAMAPNIYSFILLRLLLALGGCVGMVAARAIIRDSFENADIARAFSSLILVMGVAPIAAPTLGGLLISEWGWRSVFWVLTAYSAGLLVLIGFGLGETHAPDPAVSLRPRQVGKSYWKVLRNRQFLVYAIGGTIGMAALFTYISGAPFVLMNILDFDQRTFGWLFGTNALFFVVGSQVNRALLKRIETAVLTRGAALVASAAMLYLVVLVALGIPGPVSFMGGLFCFTFFLGLINPNLQAIALEPFRSSAGRASALMGSIRMLGGALASSLVGVLHNGTAWPMVGLMAGLILLVTALLWYEYWVARSPAHA